MDTLGEAFDLRALKKYTMTIFDLAIWNESGWVSDTKDAKGRKMVRYFTVERHIELTLVEPFLVSSVFLFDEWVVVPLKDANELIWFDKRGRRRETSTMLNNISNVRAIYSAALESQIDTGKYVSK